MGARKNDGMYACYFGVISKYLLVIFVSDMILNGSLPQKRVLETTCIRDYYGLLEITRDYHRLLETTIQITRDY